VATFLPATTLCTSSSPLAWLARTNYLIMPIKVWKFIFDLRCICSCHRKTYFKMLKKEQKFRVYIFIFYVCTPSFRVNRYFSMSCVKNINICLVKRALLAITFIFFYTQHKRSRFFMKRLCKYIERQDICGIVFIIF
jgi:hypothetical protein